MLRRLNFGRLNFLLGMVEKSNYSDYFYIKKNWNIDMIYSPYDNQPLDTENTIMQKLDPLLKKLLKTIIFKKKMDII